VIQRRNVTERWAIQKIERTYLVVEIMPARGSGVSMG
jgi:hypothetical protein